MYEKESAVESKARGGGANTFMDESFQGYPHLLDEEAGKFSRSTTPGLRVYYPGTSRPIGIGSYTIEQKIGNHTYLYEVESYWDPEKKQPRQRRKYLGKKILKVDTWFDLEPEVR